MKRVVVTGLGVLSAAGSDLETFWSSVASGQSAIGDITSIDTSAIRVKKGAEIKGFEALDHFNEKDLLMHDRFSMLGIVAARQAVSASGIEFYDELNESAGSITGSCLGGKITEDELYKHFYAEGRSRFPPLTIPRAMGNAAASHIAMEYGLTGSSFTLSTACSSSNHAIGNAFWLIRQGTLKAAVTGGSEAPFSPGHIRAWEAMRVVSADTCRPFSKDRSGMVLGEGGAMLVLEELEHARSRGAEILAEIVGFGMSTDAHHLTMPLVAGAARAMNMALSDGGIDASQVGYVNAHGTATQANDVMESNAIKTVFGEHSANVRVSSTKAVHGHVLGGAGALEAVATVMAIKTGLLPPTANFNEPDPECDINVIVDGAVEDNVEVALSNSFAFGGLNAVLAFRRWKD